MKSLIKLNCSDRTLSSFLMLVFLLGLGNAFTSLANAGSLDPSFGSNGKVVIERQGYHTSGAKIAIQADGKIVVAGEAWGGGSTYRIFVSRLLQDGAMDPSFATAGTYTYSFYSVGPKAVIAVMTQLDGKPLVVFQDGASMRMLRLTANGGTDTSFSSYSYSYGSSFKVQGAALQADGKILVCGQAVATNTANPEAWLWRFNTNGTSDPTFGKSGRLAFGIYFSSGIAVAASRSLLIGTWVDQSGQTRAATTVFTSAGGMTYKYAPVPADAATFQRWPQAFSYDAAGRLYLLCRSDRPTSGLSLLRLGDSGGIDPTFSHDGETPVTFAGSGGGYETPSGIAIQKDGRILIGGNASNGSGSFGFGVARLRWDGSLDTAFGQAGVDVVDVGSLGSVSTALALQSDGRLLQAGIGARPSGKSATIILRRLTDAPAPAPTLRIVTPPTAQSVAQGATAVFSVVAQSTPDDLALSYQWYRNSTSLQGETGPTLSVIADLTTEGNYSVKVSNGYTEAYSGAKLTAIVPPVILTQPQSITIPVKANSGISVTTKGHTPQVCEWFRNGQFVSSSSSNTVEGWFGLNVGSPGTDGAYVAVITTPDGTVTSDVVVVTLAADPSVSFTTLDQLLPLGAPLSIASLGLTTGADTRREWFRDGKAIPQATNASTYSLQKCSFADAGNYKMSFSSSHGLVWTPELKVGVVDPSPQPERVVAEGGRVQISATVAGSGLVYRWQKNGTDLTDGGQLQGTASRVLTITSASSDDAGAYICQISTSQATPPLATGATQLRVTRQVPSLEGITLPDGAIAEPYSFDLDPPIPATRFSITGLPKGLRYDGSTGLISGIPQAYGDFKVRVIATNPSGTSDPVWMALHIAQGPFPASERFSGWIDWGVASSPDQSNHPSVTEMANRLEIRLTEAGTYTGSIEFCPLLGTRYRLPIKGQLVRDATGYVATQAIQIPRYPFASGKGQMVLTATGPTSPIGVRIDFGGLTPDLPLEQTVTGTAHPVTWDSRINPATEAAGTYNVIIDGSSQVQGEPGGAGFLRLIVRSDGAVITAGQLADGSTIVGSHVLLDSKHILLRQWLYGFRGSASALLEVEVGTPPAYWDSQISGAMHWRKPRLRRDAGSNYPWGFESTRSVGPATKYLPPNTPFYSGPLMMNTSAGLGNLTVTVGGDPYGAAEATLNGSHFARSGPNPSPGEDYDAITGLRFNPKTGLFSGRIVITQYELDYDHLDRDGNPKTVRSAVSRSFRGLVGRFPSSLYGKGFGFSFFNQRYTEADPVTGKERVLIYRLSVPVAIDQTY